MQAARLHRYTDDMSEALSIDEVDRPEATGPTDVVVDVEGAGWCQTDNHIIEGMWTDYAPQDLPMTLGHENAGLVADVGEDVTLVAEGDPVICHPVQTCGTCRPCRLGEDMYCENSAFNGLTTDGGFAEYLHTTERAVIPLPDGVDPTDIAPHADAGITAYHAAKKAVAELNPGDYVVVIGIGGLGHIGLQCVDAMSAARTVAVDVKDSALGLAEELGADHTVDPTETDLVGRVAPAPRSLFRGVHYGHASRRSRLPAVAVRGPAASLRSAALLEPIADDLARVVPLEVPAVDPGHPLLVRLERRRALPPGVHVGHVPERPHVDARHLERPPLDLEGVPGARVPTATPAVDLCHVPVQDHPLDPVVR